MPGDVSALSPLEKVPDRRLDSWKEIAAYLGRGTRSVQRWEREEGLPVHRLSHLKRGSVYAYKHELDQWWAGRGGSLGTQEPEEAETARQPDPAAKFPPRLWAKSVLAAVILTAGVLLYLAINRAPKSGPEMRQLTRIGGVRSQAVSLSADGTIVAFSSDAAEEGNLDIWVQETNGAEAHRLTHGPAADLDPSVSPDGKDVLFISRGASGSAIYKIATEGGHEKMLIPEGEEPHYSPDGKRIAYLCGNQPERLCIADPDGTNRREIQPHIAQFAHPVWSPNGEFVMVYGRPSFDQPADWWVIPIGNRDPVDTGILRGLKAFFSSSTRFLFYAQAWLPDGRILFAGDQDGVSSIWQIRLSGGDFHIGGAPERITGRTPMLVPFAVAGNHIAFVNAVPDGQLWRLPVDTGQGRMLGSPRRITRGGTSQIPSLSADGAVLAYASSRSGTGGGEITDIYVRNVETGEEIVAASSTQRKGYTAVSRDGSKIAYGVIEPGSKRPIFIYDRRTQTTRKLCDDCEGRPSDWSPDGSKLLLSLPQKGIGLMDVNTGERSVISRGTSAVFSPEGRWLAIAVGGLDSSSNVYIVPFRGHELVPRNEWIEVGDGRSHAAFPSWSPDGKLLFFIAVSFSNPPNSILEARRFHPDRGQLEGRPFSIYRFEEPFLPILRAPLSNRLAVSSGQIILASEASRGEIWMTQLDARK